MRIGTGSLIGPLFPDNQGGLPALFLLSEQAFPTAVQSRFREPRGAEARKPEYLRKPGWPEQTSLPWALHQ